MTGKPKVLVIGASGQIGRRVCRGLIQRDVPIRGLSHSPTGAMKIAASGVDDIVWGDLGDPRTLKAAFHGVDHVMQVSRAIREPRQEIHAIEAAQRAGVRRVVKLSSEILYYHWDGLSDQEKATPPDMVAALHGPAEDRILDTGIDSVMLRPTWFMSIDANPLIAAGFTKNQFVWPAGLAGLALVHPDDVAESAVECLVSEHLPPSPLHLTGPKELSSEEIAAGFSTVKDATVVAASPPLHDYEEWLETVAGMPRQAGRIFDPYVTRRHAPVTDDIEQLLHRPARNFTDYLAHDAT
ncbi:NAD(P)H-binding protein [Amycolatopsis sp. NPDC051371]|uniref:SDR family oxidoreductase n=1 Tax=Amycolatopsis sp. NPDC051371 TaxID=3155800 RepID=UPI0034429AFE